MTDLRPYQLDAIARCQQAYREGARSVLLQMPTGCHRAGQRVIMLDGTTRTVESINVGDVLLGPDSQSRIVEDICRGRGQMATIKPTNGTPWTVNVDHILTLVRTNDGRHPGDVIDVSVRDWMSWAKSRKHLFKLFRVSVEFAATPAILPVDPYFLGLLLGDGSFDGSVNVCKPDEEVRATMESEAIRWGLTLRTRDEDRCPVHFLRTAPGHKNPLIQALRSLGLWKMNASQKFIPATYLTIPTADRLALLAGLIDSDGSNNDGKCFDWISKSSELARGFAFVARSVGMRATLSECKKYCQTGAGGTYHRVTVSGHLDRIPTRIARKKARARRQIKDHLRTGFSVEVLSDEEDFYGFTLSGDGRYLLDDFTVTHNSGKTHAAARGIIAPSIARSRRVAFVADLEEIVDDTADRLRAMGLTVGTVKAGRTANGAAPVQVCSLQTLARRQERGESMPPADRVIIDEAHVSSARTAREILGAYRQSGALVLGLTATPARGDGQPLDEFERLVTGPSMKELIELGALVPCEVYAPDRVLDKGVAEDPVAAVLTRVPERRCCIFAPDGAQADRIARELTARGHRTVAVLDGMSRETRRGVRARLTSGDVQSLVTVRALQKGFDAPLLDCAVLTTHGTITTYLQSIGRALRAHTAADGTVKRNAIVIDLRGSVYLHGLPADDRAWSLDGTQGRAAPERLAALRRCAACHAIFPARTICPRCGSVHVVDPRPMRVQHAEMFAASTMPVEVRAERYRDAIERTLIQRGKSASVARKVAHEATLKKFYSQVTEQKEKVA